MSFSRCLLSSALLTGVVFCGSTFPLAALGSKPVTIQLGEQQIFVGRIKEFAGPYLGFATAISFGVGAVSLATSGWQQASRKLGKVEEQMSTLQQQLQEKEALLENFKFSETKLNASGLNSFLQGDEVQNASLGTAQLPIQPPIAQSTQPQISPIETATVPPQPPQFVLSFEPSDSTVSAYTKAQAATALLPAQAFTGFARPILMEEVETAQLISDKSENNLQLNELLSHLKQVMTQLETLHTVPSEPSEHISANSNANWQQQKLAS